jgi:hypothetical protein
MDAAGVIDKLGPDTDERLSVGDQVVALVMPSGLRGGAYGDKIVLPAASVVPIPAGTGFPEAATLLMNAVTARLCLDALGLAPGKTLAVTGAAGAVGGYAMQLAKAEGLHVLADSSTSDEELIRSLGADQIVHRGSGFAQGVRTIVPNGVDGLIDAALMGEVALPAIVDNGDGRRPRLGRAIPARHQHPSDIGPPRSQRHSHARRPEPAGRGRHPHAQGGRRTSCPGSKRSTSAARSRRTARPLGNGLRLVTRTRLMGCGGPGISNKKVRGNRARRVPMMRRPSIGLSV